VTVTEEFTGTLNINGGPVPVHLANRRADHLDPRRRPDSTESVGLAWHLNGTSCAVASIHNDNAGQGSAIIGQATGTGSLYPGLRCREDFRRGRLQNHGRPPVDGRPRSLLLVLVDLPLIRVRSA
jgi:hypothetical protein